jgi:hypothetical protein
MLTQAFRGLASWRKGKFGLARMGGHLKHNGPPGWVILGRGFEKLLSLRKGWEMAQTLRFEAQDVINR